MSSGVLGRPFVGRVWVCRGDDLPSDTALDLVSDKSNRWSAEGEPTIYLSGDPTLALVEIGRHPDDLRPGVRILEIAVRIPRAVDIRREEVRQTLSLPNHLGWVLDPERTRAVARSLRHSGICDAIVVPSAGALDQPDRFNVVLFADDHARVARMVGPLRPIGGLRIQVPSDLV